MLREKEEAVGIREAQAEFSEEETPFLKNE